MTGFEFIVPEVFETGILAYEDSPRGKILACGDALSMWGIVMAGQRQPENFGRVMVTIGALLGIVPTPENFLRYSKEHLSEVSKA